MQQSAPGAKTSQSNELELVQANELAAACGFDGGREFGHESILTKFLRLNPNRAADQTAIARSRNRPLWFGKSRFARIDESGRPFSRVMSPPRHRVAAPVTFLYGRRLRRDGVRRGNEHDL